LATLKTVSGKLTDAGGNPRGGASIRATLSQACVIPGTSEIAAVGISTQTAADGTWSLSLYSNNDLTPNGTFYTIYEEGNAPFTIQVPQTAGPFPVSSIMTATPSASPTPNHVSTLTVDGSAIFTGGAQFADDQKVGIGTGDSLWSWHSLPAQTLDVRGGTAASPDTTAQPLIKFSRTVSLTAGQVIGAGEDYASTLFSGTSVPVGAQIQGVGVLGYAETYSTVVGADALAGAFEARAKGAATAHAIALFASARIDSSAALSSGATGIEISVDNETGVNDSLLAAGATITKGEWIHATGNARIGVGTQYGNPFGIQMDVGINFNSQNGGPTVTADIQSDSTAATSLLINGSHATAAIAVKAGAGMTILGGTSAAFGLSTAGLEVQGANSFVDGLIFIGSTVNAKTYTYRVRNSVGQAHFGIVGVAGDLLTGTAAGDAVIGTTTASKMLHIGGSTKVVTVTTANTLGFFGVTPVAKQATPITLGDVIALLQTYGLAA
jgi:hypothetical protein